MANRTIQPVTDNKDKQRTYSEQMGRYARAMRGAFYLEALLIDYAMLEDRLYAILYHMAFLSNRRTIKVWKKTRPYLLSMVETYKNAEESTTLGLTNISGKIKAVRCVLRWAANVESGYREDVYLCTLKRQCEGLDIGGLLDTLDGIQHWCAYRNEVIHALLNKNTDSLYDQLEAQASLGMEYARFLDTQERVLKKGGAVRKIVNAPKA